jgi:hypothetical protein
MARGGSVIGKIRAKASRSVVRGVGRGRPVAPGDGAARATDEQLEMIEWGRNHPNGLGPSASAEHPGGYVVLEEEDSGRAYTGEEISPYDY